MRVRTQISAHGGKRRLGRFEAKITLIVVIRQVRAVVRERLESRKRRRAEHVSNPDALVVRRIRRRGAVPGAVVLLRLLRTKFAYPDRRAVVEARQRTVTLREQCFEFEPVFAVVAAAVAPVVSVEP